MSIHSPESSELEEQAIPSGAPPSHFLQQALDQRGWSPDVLAKIMDKPAQVVQEIVDANARISPDTAIRLAVALGTPLDFWHHLETSYRFHQAQRNLRPEDKNQVKRRRRLYTLAPVDELARRGWIAPLQSLDDLERSVCAFLGIANPQEKPALAAVLDPEGRLTPKIRAQVAWLRRVLYLASRQPPARFEQERFTGEIDRLLMLSNPAEETRLVHQQLHDMGIHLVIVPDLAPANIDGATCYHAGRYTVALTLKESTVDAFWFAILRQLAYIGLGWIDPAQDALYLWGFDAQTAQTDSAERGAIVAQWAADRLIPPEPYQAFLAQCNGNFNRANIRAFAYEILRHPGIVVGRLKQDGHLKWRWQRQLQVDIRPAVQAWIDTPGQFGQSQ